MNVLAKSQIVKLPQDGVGLCRFNENGSASLRVLGYWIEFENKIYLPGDTAAVLEDYQKMYDAVHAAFESLELDDEDYRVEYIVPQNGRVRTPNDRTLNLPREALTATGLVVEELDNEEIDL